MISIPTGVALNQEIRKELPLLLGLILGSWGLYVLFSYGDLLGVRGARLSVAQYSVTPLILYALLSPLRRLFGVPRLLVLFSSIGVVASALFFFNVEDTSTRDLYIARLKDDVLDAKSRVLREAVKSRVAHSHAFTKVVPYFTGIYSLEDAEMFVVEREEVKALVWGGETLSLSFPQEAPLTLEDMGATQGESWQEFIEFRDLPLVARLRVVTSFPYVQLSKDPLDGTADFIARAFNGYLSYKHRGGFASAELDVREEAELLSAISIDSPWVSREHRAFPYFMLGTAYLRKAFSGPVLQIGYLRCAEHMFRKAAYAVHEYRNPELRAAIFNNAAVVKTLLFVHEKKLSLFDDAYHMYQEAIQEGGSSLAYRFQVKLGKQSNDIARYNLAKLIKMKRSVRGKPKRRRLKKRRQRQQLEGRHKQMSGKKKKKKHKRKKEKKKFVQ